MARTAALNGPDITPSAYCERQVWMASSPFQRVDQTPVLHHDATGCPLVATVPACRPVLYVYTCSIHQLHHDVLHSILYCVLRHARQIRLDAPVVSSST